MLRIKCSVCRVEHRVVERKDVEGTKKGEERDRDSRRKRRARFRLALLHNFIALSLVFAAWPEKKVEKEGRKDGGVDTLLFAGKNFSRANMIVEMRFA